jgi:hypothetical protein
MNGRFWELAQRKSNVNPAAAQQMTFGIPRETVVSAARAAFLYNKIFSHT